jgi:hypothetical protein
MMSKDNADFFKSNYGSYKGFEKYTSNQVLLFFSCLPLFLDLFPLIILKNSSFNKSGKYLTYGQEATAQATKMMDDDGKKAVIG